MVPSAAFSEWSLTTPPGLYSPLCPASGWSVPLPPTRNPQRKSGDSVPPQCHSRDTKRLLPPLTGQTSRDFGIRFPCLLCLTLESERERGGGERKETCECEKAGRRRLYLKPRPSTHSFSLCVDKSVCVRGGGREVLYSRLRGIHRRRGRKAVGTASEERAPGAPRARSRACAADTLARSRESRSFGESLWKMAPVVTG